MTPIIKLPIENLTPFLDEQSACYLRSCNKSLKEAIDALLENSFSDGLALSFHLNQYEGDLACLELKKRICNLFYGIFQNEEKQFFFRKTEASVFEILPHVSYQTKIKVTEDLVFFYHNRIKYSKELTFLLDEIVRKNLKIKNSEDLKIHLFKNNFPIDQNPYPYNIFNQWIDFFIEGEEFEARLMDKIESLFMLLKRVKESKLNGKYLIVSKIMDQLFCLYKDNELTNLDYIKLITDIFNLIKTLPETLENKELNQLRYSITEIFTLINDKTENIVVENTQLNISVFLKFIGCIAKNTKIEEEEQRARENCIQLIFDLMEGENEEAIKAIYLNFSDIILLIKGLSIENTSNYPYTLKIAFDFILLLNSIDSLQEYLPQICNLISLIPVGDLSDLVEARHSLFCFFDQILQDDEGSISLLNEHLIEIDSIVSQIFNEDKSLNYSCLEIASRLYLNIYKKYPERKIFIERHFTNFLTFFKKIDQKSGHHVDLAKSGCFKFLVEIGKNSQNQKRALAENISYIISALNKISIHWQDCFVQAIEFLSIIFNEFKEKQSVIIQQLSVITQQVLGVDKSSIQPGAICDVITESYCESLAFITEINFKSEDPLNLEDRFKLIWVWYTLYMESNELSKVKIETYSSDIIWFFTSIGSGISNPEIFSRKILSELILKIAQNKKEGLRQLKSEINVHYLQNITNSISQRKLFAEIDTINNISLLLKLISV